MRRSLPLVLVLLAACAAHEKDADRAAALGDWKTAEREYAEAVRNEPDKKELVAKYQQARASALAEARRKAQACMVAQDWECALGESAYALGLDPGDVGMASLRRDAGREAAYLRARRADEAARAGDLPGALALLEQARQASDDPGAVAEVRRVQPGIVRAAADQAERLRAEASYPQAIDLYGRAARVDPSLQPRLQQVTAEYERWKDGEAERLAQAGDGLLTARRFAEAKASYEAAARLRPQSRAAALSRYAALLAQGDDAARRRDFAAAERAYGDATRVGVDPALALAELDRVKLRPYALRLRSVLVRPLRPDGYPWAGGRNRALDRVLGRLAGGSLDQLPPGLARDVATLVPPENQPSLVVLVTLPDGRALRTAPRRGVYAVLDGAFVVTSNAYDERVLSVRVVHDDGGARPLEVGAVSFRVADLVARGELTLADASVSELRVQADPADQPEGSFSGFEPVPDPGNLAPAWSRPAPGSRGYRLVSADVALRGADAGPGAPPDLQLEIEQRGAVVFRSVVSAGRPTASWQPASAFLFVGPDEVVTVRVVDRRRGAAVLVQPVQGRALERGAVDLATPAGSTVRLRVEPRRGAA